MNTSTIIVTCRCGETYYSESHFAGGCILCSKCGYFLQIPHPAVDRKPCVSFGAIRSRIKMWKSSVARYRDVPVVVALIISVCLIAGVLWLNRRPASLRTGNSSALKSTAALPSPGGKPGLPQNSAYNNMNQVRVDYGVPAAKPVSLANGANILSPQGPRGNKYLKIINETDYDTAVKLVEASTEKTRRFFYVRAHSSFIVRGVAAEVCLLRFSSGTDWDTENHRFLRNATYDEFQTSLNFRRINYVVSLKPSLSGNAPVNPISRERFAEK